MKNENPIQWFINAIKERSNELGFSCNIRKRGDKMEASIITPTEQFLNPEIQHNLNNMYKYTFSNGVEITATKEQIFALADHFQEVLHFSETKQEFIAINDMHYEHLKNVALAYFNDTHFISPDQIIYFLQTPEWKRLVELENSTVTVFDAANDQEVTRINVPLPKNYYKS